MNIYTRGAIVGRSDKAVIKLFLTFHSNKKYNFDMNK